MDKIKMNTKHDLKNRSVSLKTVLTVAIVVGLLVFAGTYYAFGPFTSPNIELDDVASQATYTVKTDATYTWAVSSSGHIGSNATIAQSQTVIQYAFDHSAQGSVYISSGTFPVNALQVNGTYHHSIKITGAGHARGSNYGTILQHTGAQPSTLFTAKNIAVVFRDIQIDMQNDNGNAFNGTMAAYGDYGIDGSIIDNVFIRRVNPGYAGMEIVGSMYFSIGTVWIDTYGHGLIYRPEDTYSPYRTTGNSDIKFLYIRMYGNDHKGLYFRTKQTSGDIKYSCYVHISWLQIYGDMNSDAAENNTAIDFEYAEHINIDYVGIEAITYGIVLHANTKANYFKGGYMTATATAFYCQSGSQRNKFSDFWAWQQYGMTAQLIQDNSAYANEFENIRTNSSNGGYHTANVFNAATVLKGQIQNATSEGYGTAEKSDGDSITINAPRVPLTVTLSVLEIDAFYIVQVRTMTKLAITIALYDHSASANETTDKTIYYYYHC